MSSAWVPHWLEQQVSSEHGADIVRVGSNAYALKKHEHGILHGRRETAEQNQRNMEARHRPYHSMSPAYSLASGTTASTCDTFSLISESPVYSSGVTKSPLDTSPASSKTTPHNWSAVRASIVPIHDTRSLRDFSASNCLCSACLIGYFDPQRPRITPQGPKPGMSFRCGHCGKSSTHEPDRQV